MMYLMNKDVVVASFDKRNNKWNLLQQIAELPLGKFELNSWLEDRKAYKHNHHLKQLMIDCGCETTEGFIKITHAASINDSFWMKEEGENVTWNDISFYRNDFNETISKLAFEGLGLYGVQIGSVSPELTTDGSFRKCWRKEHGEIYLYKRGISGAYNAGLEPYCEALASEIIHKVDPTSVQYSVLKLYGEIATKCKTFTNEDVGFVPLRKIVDRNISLDELLDFFDHLGCREQFQRMLVLDAVTFNVDRHLGNIGVLVDNNTQKPLGIAPNFDFNLSMLPYVIKEEFGQIGTKLLDYGPAIGNDFTRVGQEMLTSEIRRELINLQGFQFAFRGNKDFEPSRVQILETMVNKQIQAILRGDILSTKDVFVPIKKPRETMVFDNTDELKAASALVARLRETEFFSSVMEEIEEDNHVCVIATLHEDDNFLNIVIHMNDMEISCDENGIETDIDGANDRYEVFSEAYIYVCRAVDELLEEYLQSCEEESKMDSTQTETLTMSDGSVYTGEVKNGLPNGQGTMKYANGDVYEGEFKDGKRNGQGTMKSNGDVYEGEWEEGIPNGQGTMKCANGEIYEGEWMGGIPFGQCKYTIDGETVYEYPRWH